MELVLEVNDRGFSDSEKGVLAGGSIMMTPALDENFWYFRVRLDEDGQAILGFPKFGTIGIGFAKEDEDWNTNLPYACPTEDIYNHIQHNKGSRAVSRDDCLQAIRMVQEAARRYKGQSEEEFAEKQADMQRTIDKAS